MELCNLKRDIDEAMSLGKPEVTARLTACIRGAADARARLGANAIALEFYIQAVRTSLSLPDAADGDLRFEQEASVRALSDFMVRQNGRDRAIAFWQALAQDHAVTLYANIADAEAKRLAPPH